MTTATESAPATTRSLPTVHIVAVDDAGKEIAAGIQFVGRGIPGTPLVVSPLFGCVGSTIPVRIYYAAGNVREGDKSAGQRFAEELVNWLHIGGEVSDVQFSYPRAAALPLPKKNARLAPFTFTLERTDIEGTLDRWLPARLTCPCCGRQRTVVMPGDKLPRWKKHDEPYCRRCNGMLRVLPRRTLLEGVSS